jgi:hypothetical protein
VVEEDTTIPDARTILNCCTTTRMDLSGSLQQRPCAQTATTLQCSVAAAQIEERTPAHRYEESFVRIVEHDSPTQPQIEGSFSDMLKDIKEKHRSEILFSYSLFPMPNAQTLYPKPYTLNPDMLKGIKDKHRPEILLFLFHSPR